MLVLSRKSGQGVRIGDDVRVVVLSNRGGVVKLGLQAPTSVSILREELDFRAAANINPEEIPCAEVPCVPGE
jgi:carbon storage regulator